MKDHKRIQTITMNYSALQGLKMIPMGFLLLLTSLWANAYSGKVQDLIFLGACALLSIFLFLLMNRFYHRTYGSVLPKRDQQKREWTRLLIGAVAGLVAFWVDVTIEPPFSLIGLVFAGDFIVEYLRITRHGKIRNLQFYLLATLLLFLLSTLPIFGINWWEPIGIKHLLLGVTTVSGILSIFAGLNLHMVLVNLLPIISEESDE